MTAGQDDTSTLGDDPASDPGSSAPRDNDDTRSVVKDAPPTEGPGPGHRPAPRRLTRLARLAMYGVVLPVVPLLLGALVAFTLATETVIAGIVQLLLSQGSGLSGVTVELAKMTDLVLVGVVLVIVAAGLLELFWPNPSGRRPTWLPGWLVIGSLDELKDPVLSMLVLVITVGFVDEAVNTTDGWRTLGLGVGSAAVVGAIALYRRLR